MPQLNKWVSLLVVFIHINSFNLFASGKVVFNDTFVTAYKHIFKFDFSEAEKLIKQLEAEKPDNPSIHFLNSLYDLFDIILFDDNEKFIIWKADHEKRISLVRKQINQYPDYGQFILAEMYLHSAIIKFRFDEYISSALDIRRCYRIHTSLINTDPDFLLSYRTVLIINAVSGTIPENYKLVLKLFGIEAELSKSVYEYQKFLDNLNLTQEYSFFENENRILLSYIYLFLLNDEEKAWDYIITATTDYKKNPLNAFFRANIAINSGRSQMIQNILGIHTGSIENSIPFNEYFMGMSKLYDLDVNALRHFANFIKTYKGENYIKDVYLKMGWAFLLKGDSINYQNSVFLVKNKGNAVLGQDKQAIYKVNNNFYPNQDLLKARLTFDGGNYERALKILSEADEKRFNTKDRSEYIYRMGRVYHKLSDYDKALSYYDKYIQSYHISGSYFAAAASLYAGEIHENKNNYKQAMYYYNLTLKFKDHPYRTSMEQKANAAIKRMQLSE